MTTLSLTPGEARLADWRHVLDGAAIALSESGAIASATSRTTEAAKEGLAAFVEKRKPEWK